MARERILVFRVYKRDPDGIQRIFTKWSSPYLCYHIICCHILSSFGWIWVSPVLGSVLGIRGILVRIGICGSIPLTNGSGSGYSRQWPSRWQLNTIFFLVRFFVNYFIKVHFHHFSKIKRLKEVTKQEERRFFLLFLLDGRIRSRIRTSYLVLMDLDPGGPKTYRSGSPKRVGMGFRFSFCCPFRKNSYRYLCFREIIFGKKIRRTVKILTMPMSLQE